MDAGHRLGHFEIQRKLGQGGMGEVDAAIANMEQSIVDRSTNRVFLKMTPDVYPGPLGDDPRFQAMLRETGFPDS